MINRVGVEANVENRIRNNKNIEDRCIGKCHNDKQPRTRDGARERKHKVQRNESGRETRAGEKRIGAMTTRNERKSERALGTTERENDTAISFWTNVDESGHEAPSILSI